MFENVDYRLKQKKIYVFILICLCLTAYAQQSIKLTRFIAVVSDDKVLLNWTLDSGSTCNGTSILKSLDGIDYDEVGKISGVCGSTTSQQSYSFIDDSPFKNQENFYKLRFGEEQFSKPLSIYFKYIEPNKVQVFPLPVKDKLIVQFNSNVNSSYEIGIHDASGAVLKRISSIQENEVQGMVDDLNQGFYILILYEDSKLKARQKFLIVKP